MLQRLARYLPNKGESVEANSFLKWNGDKFTINRRSRMSSQGVS